MVKMKNWEIKVFQGYLSVFKGCLAKVNLGFVFLTPLESV